MVNFNASTTSNNTNLRKDTAGNASRSRLKDRRSDRLLADTAAESARLLALKEELDEQRGTVEAGSKEELKQLSKDLRDSKRKVTRLEEELAEQTTALDRLKAMSVESETQSGSTNVDAIKSQLRDKTAEYKSTVAKIVQLEVKIATLQEENETFKLRFQQVTAEKDELAQTCENYERDNDKFRPVGDRENAAVIGKMEERYMKLETERDNLQGNLKAAQLKYSQLETELSDAQEVRPAADESEVVTEIHDMLDTLVDSNRRGKGGNVVKRVEATVSELRTLREAARRSAAAESARPSSDAKDHRIRALEKSELALKSRLDKNDAKFVVKKEKIKQLRDEIVALNTQLTTTKNQLAEATDEADSLAARRGSTATLDGDEELKAALALAERKVEGLELRLTGVEDERDEALTMSLKRRAPSGDGDNASATVSFVQSARAKEGVTKMAATIRDLNITITELREENLNLIIASVGV